MNPSDRRTIGRTGLEVTAFGFGTAPVGNIFREIDEATSDAMFREAWGQGVRYYDTAPMYGHGLSELRTGYSLRWQERDAFTLSSKVGRVLTPAPRAAIDYGPWVNAGRFASRFDYSHDGVMRSFEDSLQRLNLERLDICFIHDIDRFTHGDGQPERFAQAMDGAWKALSALRDQGVVGAIGVGVNEWEVCHAALERHDFDCFLLAGRYTLLEQEPLERFLPLCTERGASVVIGGGFNSGILATGAVRGAKFNYAPAPPDVMAKVARIEEVCTAHDVPLPAAAMQFVMAHPAVASLVAGTRTTTQLQRNLDWFAQPIPGDFWAELKARELLRLDAPTPA